MKNRRGKNAPEEGACNFRSTSSYYFGGRYSLSDLFIYELDGGRSEHYTTRFTAIVQRQKKKSEAGRREKSVNSTGGRIKSRGRASERQPLMRLPALSDVTSTSGRVMTAKSRTAPTGRSPLVCHRVTLGLRGEHDLLPFLLGFFFFFTLSHLLSTVVARVTMSHFLVRIREVIR